MLKKRKKTILHKEIPLLYLLSILIIILMFSFFIIIKKYIVLKIKYRKLYNSINTVLVVNPQVNEIN